MDSSIRLRALDELSEPVGSLQAGLIRGSTIPLLGVATISGLRKAILDCAHQAMVAEPVDTDRRLHSFLAKLSGTMEGLGERELDAVLWNLMTTQPAPAKAG